MQVEVDVGEKRLKLEVVKSEGDVYWLTYEGRTIKRHKTKHNVVEVKPKPKPKPKKKKAEPVAEEPSGFDFDGDS